MTSKAVPPASDADRSVCPACRATVSGKFCSECGATLGQSRCSACAVELIDGARFCHRCGLPAGAGAPPAEHRAGAAAALPWVVAAIALLAFVALIAGQKFGSGPGDGSSDAGSVAAGSPAVMGQARAPDISQLSPAERAIRLHTRVMQYHEAGKRDSLMMFAPMAIAAYEMIGDLDLDGRYDLGRIGEVSGDARLAAAQADTILAANPDHLLGLILAANAARLSGREADERLFYQRLIAAEAAERAKQLAEYEAHRNDITAALDTARRVVRR